MDDPKEFFDRIAALERELVELRQLLAERDARIAELEEELRSRDKNYRPKPNTPPQRTAADRRRKGRRRHGGFFRVPPHRSEVTHEHDVYADVCPHCQGTNLTPTKDHTDHLQVDLPEPKLEVHRFRRHVMRCRDCGETCQGRGDLELPGGHIGPRARLMAAYARGHLGISLGKTETLMAEWFGLSESRAGVLGHVKWAGKLFAPVVAKLLAILRESSLVQGDETGWRINGKNVWAWCFSNPQLAVYLIREHRNRQVLYDALGKTLPGVLVSDFYAVYDGITCLKQRCLPHLLRTLHKLREVVPARSAAHFIQPVMDLLQDAIALGKQRDKLNAKSFAARRRAIRERLDGLILDKHPRQPDCLRIWRRLFRYCGELFTFLDHPEVPSDNSGCERDIRSVAATRADGGVNRTPWGATAFANIKSVIRTCQKQRRGFLEYGLSLVRATLAGQPGSLPFAIDSG
jgi:transposase